MGRWVVDRVRASSPVDTNGLERLPEMTTLATATDALDTRTIDRYFAAGFAHHHHHTLCAVVPMTGPRYLRARLETAYHRACLRAPARTAIRLHSNFFQQAGKHQRCWWGWMALEKMYSTVSSLLKIWEGAWAGRPMW